MKAHRSLALPIVVATAVAAAGCGTSASSSGGRVEAVATTTQLADFVREVGGSAAEVTQLLQPNTDPHEYEPRPADVTRTASAKLIVESGDNLDRWMADVVKQSGSGGSVLNVADRLTVHRPGERSGPEASTYDPHWWHDPRNAETAVGEIRGALIAADPAAKATFRRNAAVFLGRLKRLDAGIARCMAQVPPEQRKLVTDHDAFGYFAARYGITVVGAVIPSQTTQAQPSARAVADLAALIRREHVRAVFPESSLNPKLADAIARQTGATANLTLYGDTLGAAGTPGASYLGMEQANADAMVKGFTGGKRSCSIPGL